jgi:hypothetical protein|eukprot:CAMPEP_0174382558 /NCGR_PEP_ID=MMETSP0811_2-20130205/124670_1 /TAXON_ID=73025 ORGANISM="Eutreptiella gymnastica-like, Strain CCMP1594" /NCGR_SAMPLE_ID=MMETSP0811_2 /ASSEMBLY_ACC=CAM_ASM_000667 /LENGTH=124 /DNA_ID=CAMNT_0015535897 /DNA_START=130 /DNA_END=504 /DNA_ORIENTATION=-
MPQSWSKAEGLSAENRLAVLMAVQGVKIHESRTQRAEQTLENGVADLMQKRLLVVFSSTSQCSMLYKAAAPNGADSRAIRSMGTLDAKMYRRKRQGYGCMIPRLGKATEFTVLKPTCSTMGEAR